MIRIRAELIAQTVDELRTSTDRERVVLWLGRRDGPTITITEVLVPYQIAEADFFVIPKEGMDQVLARIRAARVMVAAQVHTHPEHAFHSLADDRWAIVRHAGGLSLVVPRFCRDTTSDTFFDDAKVYLLDDKDRFIEARPKAAYEVVP